MKINSISVNGLKGLKGFELTEFTNYNIISGRNWAWKSAFKQAVVFCLYWKIDNTSANDGAINHETWNITVSLNIEHKGSIYVVMRIKDLNWTKIKLNWTVVNDFKLTELFGEYEDFLVAYDVGSFFKLETDLKRSLISKVFPASKSRLEIYKEISWKDNPLYDLTNLDEAVKQCKKDLKEAGNVTLVATQSIQSYQAIIAEEQKLLELPLPDNTQQIVDEIARLSIEIFEWSKSKKMELKAIKQDAQSQRDMHRYKEPTDDSIQRLRKEAEAILKTKNTLSIKDTPCFTCGQLMPTETKTKLFNEYDLKFNSIVERWKHEAARLIEDKAAWEKQLKSYDLLVENTSKEYEDEPDIDNIALTLKRENRSKYEAILREHHTRESRAKEAKEKIARYGRLIEEQQKSFIKFNVPDLEKELTILNKDIILKETSLVTDQIKTYFWKEVEIILIRQNKTNDNFKYVFDVEKNWIDYKWLSSWEKILIDIAFSKIFADKFNIGILAIDNAEQLTVEISDDNKYQQFIFKAQPCDLTLTKLYDRWNRKS